MYREMNMSKLPPMLCKIKEFTHQNLNEIIKKAYDTVLLEHEEQCNYYTGSATILIYSNKVKEIKKVRIFNKLGSEITYSEEPGINDNRTKIILNRPLLVGEKVVITYSGEPNSSDMLTTDKSTVYLKEPIFDKVIKVLYELAKLYK
jgi:hypothetical protein